MAYLTDQQDCFAGHYERVEGNVTTIRVNSRFARWQTYTFPKRNFINFAS